MGLNVVDGNLIAKLDDTRDWTTVPVAIDIRIREEAFRTSDHIEMKRKRTLMSNRMRNILNELAERKEKRRQRYSD